MKGLNNETPASLYQRNSVMFPRLLASFAYEEASRRDGSTPVLTSAATRTVLSSARSREHPFGVPAEPPQWLTRYAELEPVLPPPNALLNPK
jgi:hypothetical protein